MKTTYLSLIATATLIVACTPKPAVTSDNTVSVDKGAEKPAKNPVAIEKPGKLSLTTIDLSYMDKTVRPADDFFMFANGTWCKENPVPASESRWGSFNELDQRNKQTLKDILDKAAESQSEKGSDRQILGDYYRSFCNMDAREKFGWSQVQTRLKPILSMKSRDEIATILAAQHKVGIRSLFGFGVGQDMKNVSGNITYFSQSGIGLPNRDYYFNENKQRERDAYKLYVKDLFVLSGEDEKTALIHADMVYRFEKQLADSMMAPSELRIPEKTYNKMSFKQVKTTCKNFDFETYLLNVGSQSFDSLVIGQPAFLRQVNRMITAVPIDEWSAYLSFRTINHYAGMLGSAWVKAKFSFYQGVLSGKTEIKPIEERAIEEMTGNALGELLGKAFVQSAYSDQAQARVNQMVDNLLISFRQRIENLEWMSAATKKEALTKLNSIGRKLGFPEEWRDFSKLQISPTDYISNADNCALFETEISFEKLHKPVNRKEWDMPAHLVNAYYHPLLNEIAFPAGIMQPPFFSEAAEDAVNYGRIGMVIGHEFTHGFDDEGSKFAADGTFMNWWSEEDRHLFEQRTQLLGATFSGFCPVDGHCVNPDLTMGENIADLGGLTLAYHAYTLTEEYKSGIVREGFTPAQRFFIAYAQLWKINYTEAELKNRIANDPHSPGMYRVNGPLMNCPEFFEAFSIPEGSPMRNAPNKLAKIW